jgi:hypothetical protein
MARMPLFAALIALCGAAVAADAGFVTRKKIDPSQFASLTAALEAEMRTGGRFEYVTPPERERIDAALQRMGSMLHGKRELGELSERERVAVFNAQEEINGILTKRDGERLICANKQMVGSHRKLTVCETYAERMTRIKGSREQADDLNKRVQACREITTRGVQNSGGGGITCQSG